MFKERINRFHREPDCNEWDELKKDGDICSNETRMIKHLISETGGIPMRKKGNIIFIEISWRERH